MTDTTAYPAPSLRSTPGDSGVRRVARACVRPLAGVFAAALALQFFLAGWALFMNPAAWMWHRSAATLPTVVAVLLVIAALAGRVAAWRRWLAVAAFALVLVQGATANIRGIPGAFHPVTALLLVAVALRLLHPDPIVPHPERETRMLDELRPGAVLDERTLRPCPFCGGRAAVEPHAWMEDAIRITCGNPACPITPVTEPLLACYAAELRAAWNGRHEAPFAPPHPASP